MPKPSEVTGPHGKGADKRYNVYRNNVTVSLIDALADIYPAVARLTGPAFFREMARAYVRSNPPTSPLLFRYGQGFDAFIRTYDPASRLAYLPDVASAERAWLTAYHAADASPLAGDALAAVDPDCLGDVRFTMHPGYALIASRHSVARIFAMNRDLESLTAIDTAIPETMLITRPHLDVLVRAIPSAMTVFMTTIETGGTLGEAAEASLETDVDFDISAAISTLITSGATAALSL